MPQVVEVHGIEIQKKVQRLAPSRMVKGQMGAITGTTQGKQCRHLPPVQKIGMKRIGGAEAALTHVEHSSGSAIVKLWRNARKVHKAIEKHQMKS